MANHLWTVVAQRVIIDSQSNNTSIVDIVEQLNLPANAPVPKKGEKIPSVPIRWTIVSMWRRSDLKTPESFEVRHRMLGPKGKELFNQTAQADLKTHMRLRVMVQGLMFPFVGFGTYVLTTEVKSGKSWKVIDKQFVEMLPQPVDAAKQVAQSKKKGRLH